MKEEKRNIFNIPMLSTIPKTTEKPYDPFAERDLKHPLKDWETYVHFFRLFGIGILSLPYGFFCSGLIEGIIGTFIIGFLCCHCNQLLIETAHKLYFKTKTSSMTYPEVVESAFQNGPEKYQKFAHGFKTFSIMSLCSIYFAVSCVLSILIAKNIDIVVGHECITMRMYILMCLPPMILICYIPTLKFMVPVSVIANISFVFAIAMVFYKLFDILPDSLDDRNLTGFSKLPMFLIICTFALQTIGHIMLLENEMENPTHLLGVCGIMPIALALITIFYAFFGFFGYAVIGKDIKSVITANFERNWESKVIQLSMAIATIGTYSLMVLVAIQLIWKETKIHFENHEKAGLILIKTVFPTTAILLAVIVPSVLPFIGLISSIILSILGFIIPAALDCLVRTGDEFGHFKWILYKNFLIIILGLLCLIIGTYTSMIEIIDIYY